MEAKTFSLVAGLIFAMVALFRFVRIIAQWAIILVGAEVIKLGRLHRRWWPRSSRVET